MVLSGIARGNGRFGKHLIAKMLVGSDDKQVRTWKLQKLTTFGLLKTFKQAEVIAIIDAMMGARLAQQKKQMFANQGESGKFLRPLLELTELGGDVMRGRQPLPSSLVLSADLQAKLAGLRREQTGASAVAETPRRVKQDEGRSAAAAPPVQKPPPRNDSRSRDAARQPSSAEGGGRTAPGERVGGAHRQPAVRTPRAGTPSHHWTWQLLARGFSPEDCLAIRQIDSETFHNHLLLAAEDGLTVNPAWLDAVEKWERFKGILSDGPVDTTARPQEVRCDKSE